MNNIRLEFFLAVRLVAKRAMWLAACLFLLYMINSQRALATGTRVWTDATGHYSVTAEFVAKNEKTLILRKENGDLLEFPIDNLSEDDRTFLKQQADSGSQSAKPELLQQLTLKSGLKIRGTILDFHEHQLTLQRRLGRIYLNDRPFDHVPKSYRSIVREIVNQTADVAIRDEDELEEWVRKRRGQPARFVCQGVLIELKDENLYCVPFFLLPSATAEVLMPGWKEWLSSKDDYKRQERQAFLLRSQAVAHAHQMQGMRQIQQLQLHMQAYDAGLFSLWEVEMFPPSGQYAMPLSVVVPAVSSDAAMQEAARRNPNFTVGAARIVPRRY